MECNESESMKSLYSYKTLSIIITHKNEVYATKRGRNEGSKKGHPLDPNDHFEAFLSLYYTNIYIIYTITLLTFTKSQNSNFYHLTLVSFIKLYRVMLACVCNRKVPKSIWPIKN